MNKGTESKKKKMRKEFFTSIISLAVILCMYCLSRFYLKDRTASENIVKQWMEYISLIYIAVLVLFFGFKYMMFKVKEKEIYFINEKVEKYFFGAGCIAVLCVLLVSSFL